MSDHWHGTSRFKKKIILNLFIHLNMSTVGYLSAHIWIHQFIQFDLHQQKVKTPKPEQYIILGPKT